VFILHKVALKVAYISITKAKVIKSFKKLQSMIHTRNLLKNQSCVKFSYFLPNLQVSVVHVLISGQ